MSKDNVIVVEKKELAKLGTAIGKLGVELGALTQLFAEVAGAEPLVKKPKKRKPKTVTEAPVETPAEAPAEEPVVEAAPEPEAPPAAKAKTVVKATGGTTSGKFSTKPGTKVATPPAPLKGTTKPAKHKGNGAFPSMPG